MHKLKMDKERFLFIFAEIYLKFVNWTITGYETFKSLNKKVLELLQ